MRSASLSRLFVQRRKSKRTRRRRTKTFPSSSFDLNRVKKQSSSFRSTFVRCSTATLFGRRASTKSFKARRQRPSSPTKPTRSRTKSPSRFSIDKERRVPSRTKPKVSIECSSSSETRISCRLHFREENRQQQRREKQRRTAEHRSNVVLDSLPAASIRFERTNRLMCSISFS